MAPQILRKYSHFVVWEAFFQTKYYYLPKIKHFAPPTILCSSQITGLATPLVREEQNPYICYRDKQKQNEHDVWSLCCHTVKLRAHTAQTSNRNKVVLLCDQDVKFGPGAQGRNEVKWRPHIRTWGLSDVHALFWRQHLWYCWDFRRSLQIFGAPAVMRRPGNCALLVPLSIRPAGATDDHRHITYFPFN